MLFMMLGKSSFPYLSLATFPLFWPSNVPHHLVDEEITVIFIKLVHKSNTQQVELNRQIIKEYNCIKCNLIL